MNAERKKQNEKQKRILTASVIIALVLVIGSTFAWYTSKDSVTNRLTSSADYGVSITETFTPPDNWVPGQVISKKVGAVNTGNISAFVRLKLSNKLSVVYETEADAFDADTCITLNDVESDEKANEVLATQAGGYLVAAYTASGTQITYTSNDGTTKAVALGKVGTKYNTYTRTTDANNKTVYTFDTESKAPAAGYYIFRNEEVTSGVWKYNGFYYDGTKYYKINVTCNNQPTYGNGDTVTDTDKNGIADNGRFTISYAAKKTIETEPAFALDSTGNRIVATYSGADATNTEDDIIIYINLAEGALTNWSNGGIGSDGKGAYFFLNRLLAPGASSENLVESVELSGEVKDGAYVDLTYDLNIGLSSVQAVYTDADGTTTINEEKSKEAAKTLLDASSYDGESGWNTANLSNISGVSATVTWSK